MGKRIFIFLFIAISCSGAFGTDFPVEFTRVGDRSWIHTSYEYYAGYKTASNGMISETEHGVVLIDTAWNNGETRQILKFVESTIGKPVLACIITHFHEDRAGGLLAIAEADIPIHMTSLTYGLLGSPEYAADYLSINENELVVDAARFVVDYFSPAHSRDNIVVFDVGGRILFAGCIAKSMSSKNLGSMADADRKNWPIVLERIKLKYKGVGIVIPGHGHYGDMGLIDHTLELLR